MPRPIRIKSAGHVHHVICRGNDGQDIFKCDDDFYEYISLLNYAKKIFPLKVYNYVLMDNHIHLLVEPTEYGSLSKVMECVSKEYAKFFNKRYNRAGHVFQGRFKSFLIETQRYFFTCSRYIDLNPVKAGKVTDPRKYLFSGSRFLLNGQQTLVQLDKHSLYRNLGKTENECQIAYRALVMNFHGIEIDFMTKRAGILGSKEFKKNLMKDHKK